MSIFYNPGPIPGWPVGKPRGSQVQDPPGEVEPRQQAEEGETIVETTTQPAATGLELHTASSQGDLPEGARLDPAEPRVRALRDAIQAAAEKLDPASPPLLLQALHDDLWAACTAVHEGDLGEDGHLIGQQFEAFFERLRDLAASQAGPVAPDSLGLPADARFLNDMAEYLTQRFSLDAEEE